MTDVEGSYNLKVTAQSGYVDRVNPFCILFLEVAIGVKIHGSLPEKMNFVITLGTLCHSFLFAPSVLSHYFLLSLLGSLKF